MTVRELMARIAGADYDWVDVDKGMLDALADIPVREAMVAGIDPRDGRPTLMRLPVANLRKKERSQ